MTPSLVWKSRVSSQLRFEVLETKQRLTNLDLHPLILVLFKNRVWPGHHRCSRKLAAPTVARGRHAEAFAEASAFAGFLLGRSELAVSLGLPDTAGEDD